MSKAIPDGYHAVTPYLVVRGAAGAIEFYKKAFGAVEHIVMKTPDGGAVMHAELKIGNCIFMLGEEMPNMGTVSPATLGGTASGLMLYVEDADASFQRALDSGATVEQPLMNMFWGDRYGRVKDPFGHAWSIATHIEDVAPEEMDRRMKEWMAKSAAGGEG